MTRDPDAAIPTTTLAPTARRPARAWAAVENGLLVFTLAAMVLLPLLEALLRKAGLQGISGSTAFTQHGCLIIGLIGAAVAARQERLLSLATARMLPGGTPRAAAKIASSAVAAAISIALVVGSWQFVSAEREAGKILAYGIPVWSLQALLPIGFACIALRLLWHSGATWRSRSISVLIVAGLLMGCVLLDPARLMIPLLAILLASMVLGAPIFALLGGAAAILFWAGDEPLASISIAHYSLVTNPTLPTIPLFTLAGYFLAEGGASSRLVRVFTAIFGRIRGGPAIVTAVLCAFFTSFTGASGVTILALGGVLMPILLAAGYSNRGSLGLLTGAGSLGMLFPPCLPLILYAIIANLPIEQIFLGAIIPGLLLLVMTAAFGVFIGPRHRDSATDPPAFDWREATVAIWQAKWELLMPVVALGGLLGGIATPVEAAAATAGYAFVTQTLIRRDLSLRRNVPHAMVECGLVIGGVLLILGLAQGFTNYLIDAQLPQQAVAWVTDHVHSRFTFLLLLNVFLLIVGGVMDVYPAIVVVVPLMVPIGRAFGIDPIHLGVIFLANLELGFMMPPAGLNLLLSAYRFNRPLTEVCRSIIPIFLIQLTAVLLITYVPILTTGLPAALSSRPP